MAAEELEALLGGKGWPVPAAGGCDPGGSEPVRLRGNVCYVVLAVLLNEKDEVLVMQEAKAECYGSWYLPAGRMEPRETVAEAVRREVQEETGLQCQPLTLLAVEERGPSWIRFVFLARPTGGGHLGQHPGQSDGVCFNVVATVGSEGSQELAPPALQEPAFTWWEVERLL
uniref:Nudix hydrolase 18 n=1 Tax=Naja naja TaxID=35670 RepID=A0A8C6VP98_NAJNA